MGQNQSGPGTSPSNTKAPAHNSPEKESGSAHQYSQKVATIPTIGSRPFDLLRHPSRQSTRASHSQPVPIRGVTLPQEDEYNASRAAELSPTRSQDGDMSDMEADIARAEDLSPSPDSMLIRSSIPLGLASVDLGGPSTSVEETQDGLVPTTINWHGGGKVVKLAGTFERAWRGTINMAPDPANPEVFSVTIRLNPGTHRLKFVVDDQWRCSDDLPTATDNDGHLVNYIEISPPNAWDPSADSSSNDTNLEEIPFGDVIPPHLIHSALLEEQYLSQQLATPPPTPHPATLPRHLEKVILNTHRHGRDRAVHDGIQDDNSVLPIPNHVVLNHLGTSAIKNGVLAVATTMRYKRKYISTLYFKPVRI